MAIKFVRSTSAVGKLIMIGAIVLALLIPLTMLRGLVSERSSMRDQAHATVAQGWGGDITTAGPMAVVPFEQVERNEKGERILVRRQLYVLPTTMQIDVEIIGEPEKRRIGIYEVPVYLARARISGEFQSGAIAAAISRHGVDATFRAERGKLRMPISDAKSLRALTLATVNGKALTFAPASPGIFNGIQAEWDLNANATAPMKFEFEMTLAGSRTFSVLPIGATTQATLKSAWPDPKFSDTFLPADRTVSQDGFNASWQVLELNRTYGQSWIEGEVSSDQLAQSAFGVELFRSVDVYQRSERAVKYALLFIALTFLSFLAWEQISKVPVHPMQYLLIGLALSVFYLLLIALSEHISFMYAYWTAAGALIVLLAVYTASALQGLMRGIVVGGAMTLTYAVLYMLVLSEQYALLMGAIALFVTLAVVMLATRKVQWYREEQ
jgi:inner membrane protein